MSVIGILEVFYEYDYVTFYTVRLEIDGNAERLTETDKFYEIYNNAEHPYYNEFDTIVRVIDGMGNYFRGAEACLFRSEDAAHALPPKNRESIRVLDIEIIEHSELRLYCLRLTNGVVFLFNGGVKTTDQALDCPNVKGHFRMAQKIANAIDEMIANGEIAFDGTTIINNTGDEEIIFYL